MRARPTPLLCALAAVALSCSGQPVNPAGSLAACVPTGPISVGEELPDCTFEGFPGTQPLRLTELKGKPIVLNFWASWCLNCVKEMPDFQRVFESLGGRVTFVGMNVTGLQGETKEAGMAFAKRAGVRYLLAFDDQGLLYSHFSTRQRPVMPLTLYIGPDLRVKERHFGGPISQAELRTAISTHLGVS